MGQRTGPPKTILIIEDDPDIRESLRLVIEDEGHLVKTAENGRTALEALGPGAPESDLPCLILLDLMMPEMNGEQFLRALRERNLVPEIPVVIVSAWPNEAARLAADVRGFLGKPVNLARLLATVEEHCDC